MNKNIKEYNYSQAEAYAEICDFLMSVIDKYLPEADSKIWHAHPVWFLNGNPIVGYSALKGGIKLLFWSGQSFDEDELKPQGSFKAAEILYTNADQISKPKLKRWLEKSLKIQWDYKNIVKRKGTLDRLI